jgi:hypothetical protein
MRPEPNPPVLKINSACHPPLDQKLKKSQFQKTSPLAPASPFPISVAPSQIKNRKPKIKNPSGPYPTGLKRTTV